MRSGICSHNLILQTNHFLFIFLIFYSTFSPDKKSYVSIFTEVSVFIGINISLFILMTVSITIIFLLLKDIQNNFMSCGDKPVETMGISVPAIKNYQKIILLKLEPTLKKYRLCMICPLKLQKRLGIIQYQC